MEVGDEIIIITWLHRDRSREYFPLDHPIVSIH
jgi:hypothetical protein